MLIKSALASLINLQISRIAYEINNNEPLVIIAI